MDAAIDTIVVNDTNDTDATDDANARPVADVDARGDVKKAPTRSRGSRN